MKRKPKVKQGRPLKYVGQNANLIAKTVKAHGAQKAVEVLRSVGGIFAKISYPTVLKLVHERYHMTLAMGRRAA